MRTTRPPLQAVFAALAIVLMSLGITSRATAKPPTITIENVRLGFGRTIKAGTWTPVWVDLKAGPAKFSGFLDAVVPDDDQTPTLTRRPVYLNAGDFATFVTYVRPGITNPELTLRVLDDRMRNQTGNVNADDKISNSTNNLDPSQSLLLTIGNPAGVDEVPTLSGFSGGRVGSADLVVAKVTGAGDLPSRWYGYDAVHSVILDTNDTTILDALDSGRDRVLVEWVRNGGHLVITGTSNWQRLKEGGFKDLLPALPTGTTRLNDLGALETFAGSAANPITDAMVALTLEDLESRGGHALATTSTTPIVVRGSYGFGRVTLVGLDTDIKPFSTWKDKLLFWVKVLDLHGRGNDPNTADNAGVIAQTNVSDLATLLHRSLDDFPGVTLVPFGWVALFVFLYILLIGPGDYFFLKKVVKRMELTWITFPLIVILVSAAAYTAAYTVKGTDLRVNKVDLIDIDQSRNLVRGTTWLTVFSPKNRDYDIGISPLPVDQDYKPDPANPKPRKPTAGVETIVTAFGPHDAPLGGGGGRLSLGGTGYAYAPMGEAEELDGVRVPIWSTKSILGRWTAPQGNPLVETSLIPVGTDRISGTITNRSQRTLKNTVLIFGKQIYDKIGTIAPGATVRVDAASRTRTLSGFIGDANGRISPFASNYNYYLQPDQQSRIPPDDLLRVMMFRDALGNRSAGLPSVPFSYLDLSGQLALDRPILVASLDGPGALLDLHGGSSTPINIQTTMVRILLPLGNPADETDPSLIKPDDSTQNRPPLRERTR